MGLNLGRLLFFCSQILPHNAVRDEFGASLFMNLGKANIYFETDCTHLETD